MIFPSPKLIVLLLLPGVLVAVAPVRAMVIGMIGYDVALLLLVALDLAYSARPGQVRVTRRVAPQLSLGAENKAGWEVHNASDSNVALEITDSVPPGIDAAGLPLRAKVLARSRAKLSYTLRPSRRGLFELGDVYLRYQTRLGLAIRQARLPMHARVKVYPNVASISRYRMSVSQRRLLQMGLNASRQRGRGGQFESLREYIAGDDLADISWKTSARRGKLITRNYESERSRNILLVIDSGRLMSTEIGGMSRLDYAINASLLLTYAAVKQGDYIGMVAFSDRVESYMPLMKGHAALTRMNEGLYRLEPRLREPDYERACRFLGLKQRKRSLIVIFTEVVDTEVSATLLAYTARFARHHLPLCVTMRDPEIEAVAHANPLNADDCFRQAVALQMIERRSLALARMRASGVDVLDAQPRTLTPNLIERYMTMKQRNRL